MRATFSKRLAKRLGTVGVALLLLGALPGNAQILHKKKKVDKSTSADNNAEPDKILYDKAMDNLKHGRHEVARLNLQTLINTYPDSEYLAKAKLAIADSFFKQGGTANTTQAIQAYQDFDVFFPMMPEAAYAQLQVAMAHFRQLEKPDRDRSEARAAEDAFQTFLQKYPDDPLAPKAEQHLREVQEVMAEGDFRIGSYYYITKGDKRAAASRLVAVVNRYPLYSKADQALWMLGSIWEGTEKKEFSVPYYARLVREYPLSPLAPQAKDRLKALKAPVPQPDPQAVAWMTAEKNAPRKHEAFVTKPIGMFRTGPRDELYSAATTGKPTMTPESESEAGFDILSGGSRLGSGVGTGIVATVQPGQTAPAAEGAENVAPAGTANPGAEQKTEGQREAVPPTTADPNAAPVTGEATAKAESAAGAAAGEEKKGAASEAAGASGDAAAANDSQTANPDDKKKESSSKKKKGLKKIVPW